MKVDEGGFPDFLTELNPSAPREARSEVENPSSVPYRTVPRYTVRYKLPDLTTSLHDLKGTQSTIYSSSTSTVVLVHVCSIQQ